VTPKSQLRTSLSARPPLARLSSTPCDHVNTGQISAQTADVPPGSRNCRHQQACAQSHSHRPLKQPEQESAAYFQACEDIKSKGNTFRKCSRPTSEQHTCGATPSDSCTSGCTRSLGVTTPANNFDYAIPAPAKPQRDSSAASDHPDTFAIFWLIRSDPGQPTVARLATKAVDNRLLHSTSESTWPQNRCRSCNHAQW
jgi:hypothetical protein